MTAFTVQVISDDPSPINIPGVVVEIYNLSSVFQTGGTTDSLGEVNGTLPDGSYDVLFFKQGVSILPSQPQRIVVDHTQLSNHFQVTAHIRTRPESIDSTKCMVSGYLLGVGGEEVVHRLIFRPDKRLLVINNNIIAPRSRIEFTSDDSGYFQFELLRNMAYDAYFVFPQDLFEKQADPLEVITPNAASVDLNTFLFPLPINFVLSASTISLVAGSGPDKTTTFTLTFTDGSPRNEFSTPWTGIDLTNTDNTVASASMEDGVLTIIPLKAGTTTISTAREIPSTILFNPLPAYTSGSIVVTVT
jgi:hypothetical protein